MTRRIYLLLGAVTAGLVGCTTVTEQGTLESADNTEIKVQRASISQVVPKGTFEEA